MVGWQGIIGAIDAVQDLFFLPCKAELKTKPKSEFFRMILIYGFL